MRDSDEGALRRVPLDNPFRCPECGLPANDVDGDPFADEMANPLSIAAELHINIHCDNGHSWFEAARFGRDGKVTDRVAGIAGAPCPWNAAAPSTRECEGCGQRKPIEEMQTVFLPGTGETYQCEQCRGLPTGGTPGCAGGECEP